MTAVRTSIILQAVAERLADTDIGTWDPDGSYAPSDTGIVFKTMPTGPDRVIVLNTYSLGAPADPGDSGREFMLQVRTRAPGRPDAVDDLAEDAAHVLITHAAVWGDLRVQRCTHQSTAQMGLDSNRRTERSDNFHLLLQHQS